MKITITIDLTAACGAGQTSLTPMPFHGPATGRSSSGAAGPESQPLESPAPDKPLPFAAGTPPQTSAASSDEAKWLDLARIARSEGLLDLPQWSPQEFDSIQRMVLGILEEEARQASGAAGPPPPHAPAGSSASPEPNSGDFRFKANLERFFATFFQPPRLTTLTLIPCTYSPRVEHIADFAAGLLSIQRHGIPQIIQLHPEDIALIQPLIP